MNTVDTTHCITVLFIVIKIYSELGLGIKNQFQFGIQIKMLGIRSESKRIGIRYLKLKLKFLLSCSVCIYSEICMCHLVIC